MESPRESEGRLGEKDEEEKRKDELDKEEWRCLKSVHEMLCHRQILNHQLRKGWMELASARYEMGPARLSQNLFSLKPQAAKAVVDVGTHSEGRGDEIDKRLSTEGPVLFELIKDSSVRGRKVTSYADEINSKYRKKNSSSQIRRRPVSIPAVQVDTEKDELLEYANLIDDSDSEDDMKPLEVQKNTLQGFGAIVVPQLRNAQGSFAKALQVMVELLNAQSNATDAHCKAMNLQASIDSSVGQ